MVLFCIHASCGYAAKTKHALDTHISLAHRRGEDRRPMNLGSQIRKRRLSIPSSIKGTGHRLPIDRVTAEVQKEAFSQPIDGDTYDVSLKETYEMLQPFSGAFLREEDVSNVLTDEQKSFQRLATTFLSLGRTVADGGCNGLLSVLVECSAHLASFLKEIKTMKDVREYCKERFTKNIENQGFAKKEVVSNSGLSYTIYWKDPVNVLSNQLRCTSSDGVILKPINSDIFSHPMNSLIGNKACAEAEILIKSMEDVSVSWKETEHDGEQSFVGGLQLFSDKSVTSLSAGALTFYPLHITLVNFNEESRRNHIVNNRTVTAYLPVRYDQIENNRSTALESTTLESTRRKKIGRSDTLRALHESISFALRKLYDIALPGCSVRTRDGNRLRLHLILASYISDIPEAEDLLSVKRGTTTSSPCHRCLVTREDMPYNTQASNRTLSKTIEMIQCIQKGDESVAEMFKQYSMMVLPPVLFDFPLVGLVPCVDIYSIFCYEPMHNLHLGVSKLLKECLTVMLKDGERVSTAIVTAHGHGKPFNIIRRTILFLLNDFLTQVQHDSPGYGLHLDYSKGECNGRLSGFFTETGVLGMLEASDYKDVDAVSPFFGSIVDRLCGLPDAPVTKTFTLYVDMVDNIFRRRCAPGWNDEELNTLKIQISEFKNCARDCFQKYQASKMGTSKFHCLDHVVEDLRSTGGAQYLHGGLYEQAHKCFKKNYSLTSKRKGTCMDEALNRDQERQMICNSAEDTNGTTRSTRRVNPSRIKAVRSDGAFCVAFGKATSLLQLQISRQNTSERARNLIPRREVPKHVADLATDIGEDGLQVLLNLLKEEYNSLNIDETIARHSRIELPASAYVSGYSAPSLRNASISSSVIIPNSTYRSSQRVVAKATFYGKSEGRHDDIMIENGDVVCKEGIPIWFGKALTFLRLVPKSPSCTNGNALKTEEYCFVQYYDILGRDRLTVDKIDETLDCVRLRWQRTIGVEGTTLSAKEYGLIPVDSIRGVVHIVRADTALHLLDQGLQRCKEHERLRNGERGWAAKLFYVNRFFFQNDQVYDVDENP